MIRARCSRHSGISSSVVGCCCDRSFAIAASMSSVSSIKVNIPLTLNITRTFEFNPVTMTSPPLFRSSLISFSMTRRPSLYTCASCEKSKTTRRKPSSISLWMNSSNSFAQVLLRLSMGRTISTCSRTSDCMGMVSCLVLNVRLF